MWKAYNLTQNLIIPLETKNSQYITGFVVLEDNGFPDGGQNTLLDYAGSNFREGGASLTIHRELIDPSLEDGYTVTLLKLAQSIDHCNVYTFNHAVKTAFWARRIASELGFSQADLDQIELASKLHDVGKVVVPKTVLTKPSKLSDQEWMIMKRHPTFGAMIMNPSPRLHPLIPIIQSHHEKYDGSGYPQGLFGEEIPIQARIISVADSYTTITAGRAYRLAGSKKQAIRELVRCSEQQFDPEITTVMVRLLMKNEIDDSDCSWLSENSLPHPDPVE